MRPLSRILRPSVPVDIRFSVLHRIARITRQIDRMPFTNDALLMGVRGNVNTLCRRLLTISLHLPRARDPSRVKGGPNLRTFGLRDAFVVATGRLTTPLSGNPYLLFGTQGRL